MVVRRLRGRWYVAVISPSGRDVWALPKGLVDEGERPAETAVREAAEEAGVEARVLRKLGDVRYVYTWEGERVFKVVSFFLLRYVRGRLGRLPARHAHEISEARWLPLEEAPHLLAYRGEREMVREANRIVEREEL